MSIPLLKSGRKFVSIDKDIKGMIGKPRRLQAHVYHTYLLGCQVIEMCASVHLELSCESCRETEPDLQVSFEKSQCASLVLKGGNIQERYARMTVFLLQWEHLFLAKMSP